MQTEPAQSLGSTQTRLEQNAASEEEEPTRLLEQNGKASEQLRADLQAAKQAATSYDAEAGLRRLQQALQSDEVDEG